MVLQTVLHVVEEGEDVESVQAAVQQSVHTLERSLPKVQPIIHRVFEGSHLHLQSSRTVVRRMTSPTRSNRVGEVLTSRISSFRTLVSLYSCGRTESSSSRIRLGLLWAAELNVTKATRRTFKSGSSSVFRKSPEDKNTNQRTDRGGNFHFSPECDKL